MPKEKIAKIEKILWEDWDPIGVNSITNAKDEYDGYALQICSMSIQKVLTVDDIKNYLNEVEKEKMGLTPNDARNTKVAEILIAIIKN